MVDSPRVQYRPIIHYRNVYDVFARPQQCRRSSSIAQTEASDDYLPISTSSGQGSAPPAGAGLYHLLDLINTAPISSTSSASSKLGEGLWGNDPRSDLIKSGMVGLNVAPRSVSQFITPKTYLLPLLEFLPFSFMLTSHTTFLISLFKSARGHVFLRVNLR